MKFQLTMMKQNNMSEQEMFEKHKCTPGAKFKRAVYIFNKFNHHLVKTTVPSLCEQC